MNNFQSTIQLGTGSQTPIELTPSERRRHLFCAGKTGTGKSTLLENIIAQDIQAGHGVGFIDPHGDSAETVLNYVPRRRIEDVIYWDIEDTKHPITLNVLETDNPEQREFIADGLITSCAQIWSDSWGPRLEHYLRNTVLALMEAPGQTMLGIPLMLTDDRFRRRIVRRVQNPIVRRFWEHEFAENPDRYNREAAGPVLNKIEDFLVFPIIRNILGFPKSSINLRRVMDEGRILIVRLPKGRFGPGQANLLGSLIVTRLQLAAMSRADIPIEDRRDFHCVIDEFQNFSTQSFSSVLSEARKYRLSLVLSTQYADQIDPAVRDAVFGNVGSLVVFRVGAKDAENFYAKELAPMKLDEITELPNFHAWVKTPREVQRQGLKTHPPAEPLANHAEKIKRKSRWQWSRPKTAVESRILRFLKQLQGRG